MSLMRRGHPDHLYLERGGEWDLDVIKARNVPSGATSSPAVLGYYGFAQARPVLNTHGRVWDRLAMDNLVITGWHFKGKDRDPHVVGYIPRKDVAIQILYASNNLRFDDVKFSYLGLVAYPASHLDSPSMAHNLMINRTIFVGNYHNESSITHGARASNLYIDKTNGVTIEESVFDFGGWYPGVENAGANKLSHCFYGQYGNPGNTLEVRANIFSRCASHALQVRWGGLVEDNFFARNSIAIASGYHLASSPKSPQNSRHHVINNVITETASQYRGDNHCQGAGLCTGASWGIEMLTAIAGTGSDFIAKGNKIGGYNLTADGGNAEAYVYKRPIDNVEGVHYEDNAVDETLPTLADYAQHLKITGADSYNAFMHAVTNRPVGVWKKSMGARMINDYMRSGGIVSKPQEKPKGVISHIELVNNSTCSDAQLVDMPTTYSLGSGSEGVWFGRYGTFNQGSSISEVNGDHQLNAGSGTTNGAMQVVPWPTSNSVQLSFDYTGKPAVELLGGKVGDTIAKYNSDHSLTTIVKVSPENMGQWATYAETHSLQGDYDFLIIRFKYGSVDNVSLKTSLLVTEVGEPALAEIPWVLEDMGSSWAIASSIDNVWYSRLGTCGQCSSLATDNFGDGYMQAAAGTSNGALTAKLWVDGAANLSFLYKGEHASVKVFGAYSDDTASKWNSGNTMSLLRDFPLEAQAQWQREDLSFELQGDFDYLVIQVYGGDFDSLSLGGF